MSLARQDLCPIGRDPFAPATRRPSGLEWRQRPRLKEVGPVKTWLVVGSATAVAAVGVALLAGKDDIRRFWRMHTM